MNIIFTKNMLKTTQLSFGLLFIAFFGLCFFVQAQQPIPAPAQIKAIVLKNAIIHKATGEVLNNASIRFENGIITEIGNTINPANAEEIDLQGQHIYPSLILPATALGITEVASLRPTHDYAETGLFNPNARSLVAFNTDSEISPTLRSNGILLVQSTPKGGLISGTSSVMELEGWNWEDAQHKADMGLHLNWVSMYQRGGFFSPSGRAEKNEKYQEIISSLDKFFTDAKIYFLNKENTPKNLKMEAMRGLFDGSKTLFINASYSKDIIESVQFAKKHEVKKIVIVGGEDALQIAEFLKTNNIPIILGRLHRLPYRPEEDVWLPYKLPYLLKQAGILVGLAYDENDVEPMGTRNLPFLAGTASAYGLSKEDALMTVTANTAKILGIADKVGTLEVGKHATLVVSKGDILDMRTNNVTHAFVRGKKLDLNDKHKELYQRYKKKYQK